MSSDERKPRAACVSARQAYPSRQVPKHFARGEASGGGTCRRRRRSRPRPARLRVYAHRRRHAPPAPVGTSGRGGEEEERNLATPGVRAWWRRRGAQALTRAARGYESASTSTSTSKSTDDADRAKPPPKKDYRRNRRPKAGGGAGAKPRYNRPPLHDPSSSADAGADEDSHAQRPSGGDRPKWLSHQHTRTPGQQPQQRRGRGAGGFPYRGPDNDGHKTKMNANNRHHGGMRPGERIVKAMEALPRASVAGIASEEGEDVARALRSPETYGRAYPAANVDAYVESPRRTLARNTAGKNTARAAGFSRTSTTTARSGTSPPRTHAGIRSSQTQTLTRARAPSSGTGASTRR